MVLLSDSVNREDTVQAENRTPCQWKDSVSITQFGKPKWWDGKEECAPSVPDMWCGGGHVEDHRKGGWGFFFFCGGRGGDGGVKSALIQYHFVICVVCKKSENICAERWGGKEDGTCWG